MTTQSAIEQITQQIPNYIPAAIAAVQVVEAVAPTASGADKQQAAVNAIIAGSGVLATSANVPGAVSAIAGLVDIVVSIMNAFGVFSHESAS